MPDNFLSKSWLFEIVDTESKKVINSFTLVLPPQSYSIKEKQRVSITKTFGSVFVDDYGPDNLEITIQGISGTAHVFPTYRRNGIAGNISDYTPVLANRGIAQQASDLAGGEGYDGKGAFYTFRNDIMRYKDSGDYSKKELRVYDLADEQAYKCILLEFSLNRNSDQPLRYPFSISLFVYARLDSKQAAKPKVIKIGKDPVLALNNIDELLAQMKSNYRNVQNFLNQITTMEFQANLLRTKITTFLAQTKRVAETPLTTAKSLLGTSLSTLGVIKAAYDQGKMTLDSYMRATEMMDNTIKETLRAYGFAITEGTQQSQELVIEQDNGLDLSSGTVDKSSTNSTFSFTGLSVYTVVGNETLQDIALAEMGDSSLWPYVAMVNDIEDNTDITAGEQLYIPVVSDSSDTTKDSYVLSEDISRDPYGSDIQLDSNGDMVLYESNDVSTTSGLQNVQQSVDIRLSTLEGSVLTQTALGISAQAGYAGTDLALSYLRMNIRSSLIQDPRIESVKNIQITMDGGRLMTSMDISVVGYDSTLPVAVAVQ